MDGLWCCLLRLTRSGVDRLYYRIATVKCVCVGGRQYQADIEMHAQMDMYVSACLYQMVYVHIVLYSRTRE